MHLFGDYRANILDRLQIDTYQQKQVSFQKVLEQNFAQKILFLVHQTRIFSLFLEKLNECFYHICQMKSELHELSYKIVCLRNPTTKDSISSPHQHQPPIDETIALSKPSLVSTLSSGNGRTGHGDSIRSLPNNGFIIGGGSCTSTSTTATLGRYFSGICHLLRLADWYNSSK